jgi:hypothetical protein
MTIRMVQLQVGYKLIQNSKFKKFKKFKNQNSKFKIQNSKFKIQKLQKNQNLKFKIQNSKKSKKIKI